MAKSDNLQKAKKEKNDEFYTKLEDIEEEILHHKDYIKHFRGKTVYCNCDNPEWSNFYIFFRKHFKELNLKKFITTHFNKDGSPSYKIEWFGEMLNNDPINMIKTKLKGDGDFRSDECIEILKEADIVVTNPPFSLFREYVSLLEKFQKKYVILGNQNAITYKEFFPLLKDNKVFIGYQIGSKSFRVLDDFDNSSVYIEDGVRYAKFGNICWFTNLDLDKSHQPLILTKNYKGNEEKYPRYDNYDAINVDKVKDIPKDYYGTMGVPLTFLAEYCQEQFEILGLTSGRNEFDKLACPTKKYINAKQINTDGSETSGSKSNTRACILLRDKPNKVYYIAENADGYLQIFYARILIRRKQSKNDG